MVRLADRDLIADEVVEAAARHRRIKPAVQEMIRVAAGGGATSVTCEHEFECEVDGQKYDVKITLEVAGKKKH